MPESNVEPQLTVIMAVHNGSPFLRTAIESILNQTYSNFNFLVIDDASTDDTREIVRSYNDDRITLECLEKNVGQTAALNIGLKLAKTPWIARLDADDYSAPTRFEEQMRALEADPSISCIGTHVWMFHDNPEVVDDVFATPEDHADIKHALLRGSPMVHGSIIADRAALLDIGGFDERYRLVADLELFDRLVLKYKAANIPLQLVGIRQHPDQTSGTKLAFDEVIEICNGRLLTGDYSRPDVASIKATLSRAYLYRAQFREDGNSFSERMKGVGRAFRVSPNTFIWNFLLVNSFSRFSKTHQEALRKVLAKSVPKFLTGR
jgi:glycosyltransferase involved in cell wall biosynthesis